jgi:superfamily II DNA or RNA helicase
VTSLEALFARIQKECLPGIWSKGMALSRVGGCVRQDVPTGRAPRPEDEEIALRVSVPDRAVSPKVSLWPAQGTDDPEELADEGDWHCDCGDRAEICAHVAASVIALKSGQAVVERAERAGSGIAASAPRLLYRFSRLPGGLLGFERVVRHGEREHPLAGQSLVAFVGGIESGRIVMPPLSATREDFAIDGLLSSSSGTEPSPTRGAGPARGPTTALNRTTLPRLLAALARAHAEVTLDGQPIRISLRPTGLKAELRDAPSGGFRLSSFMDASILEVFGNGAAICGAGDSAHAANTPQGALHPLQVPTLDRASQEALGTDGQGRVFKSPAEIARLVSEILPALETQLPLEILTERLPTPVRGTPKASLRLDTDPTTANGSGLVVTASIHYSDRLAPHEILVADPVAESQVTRKLRNDLHLSPGQPVRLGGQDAIDFALKLQGHMASDPDSLVIQGGAVASFGVASALIPRLEATDMGFRLTFSAAAGGNGAPGAGASRPGQASEPRQADPARVLQAWRDGSDYVSLIGGGWAPLPHDWLKRYGARVMALLEARGHADRAPPEGAPSDGAVLPPFLLPSLAELCEETGAPLPEKLRRLRDRLADQSTIPEAKLPQDLRADLRDYQRQGINWLCWLRDAGMGALLADDMGLGKTLQALCAIRGRTLVVCPTSVLSAWSEQIARFRPGLKLTVYHGPGRSLPDAAQAPADGIVVLTTYAILRLDREALSASTWDTLVLDEAQTIKNPGSQAAKAAHALRGAFRIALSGTPVENRLEDLWSQFQFANPGLLGSRATFQEELAAPIARGDAGAAQRLRARVQPFLLRRLKREVARELPPRTETVLHCELSEQERELYDSILAASRREVLEKLEQGASVFAALEMLLRLRQAACSPALVPGGAVASSSPTSPAKDALAPQASAHPSSKLKLLRDSLRESIDLGHRALVFSQWTSLLDLIEPIFRDEGISYLRLDGSTRDREAVVREFQAPGGPSVLLISLKAGGTGLTLTAADHVYLMDPWWNPAVEDQAADRAHRIGQDNPVLIQRLVARDTVEDRILALQKLKQELAGSVLDGSGRAASITQDDLIGLLGG